MSSERQLTGLDEEMAARVQELLPARVFDAHAHVYDLAHLDVPGDSFLARGPARRTAEGWREAVGALVGEERLDGGLLLPFPSTRDATDAANRWLVEQLDAAEDCRGGVLVAPGTSPEATVELLEHPRVVALKPYHLLAEMDDTWQATPEQFVPTWAWKLAEERGLAIVLHLVRDGAIADPQNQRYIRSRCLDWPGARLVLAHAGRAFHAPNAREGLSALRDLDNLWFDLSGICEAEPILAILDEFGPRRVMFGTDFPVSHMRGRAVTVGDGFAWLTNETVRWEEVSPPCERILVGLESLRAIEQAARRFGLSDADLQRIFATNARRLFGIEDQPQEQTRALYEHARERIPGGTQLLSKRPEMFAPGQWPAYFSRARGCEVWDLDGRHYHDMSSASVGAAILGFADPDVSAAVRRRVSLGSWCPLNPPEEVELADRLCEIHPWAECVRFARGGGEACTVAVRIARATTDRSTVAISGYHGWHDWYLAANLGESDALRGHLLPGLKPLGVPRELRGTVAPFRHGDREALQEVIDRHGDELAAIIMEPCRHHDPPPGFLTEVRDLAHDVGALLIFDEVSIGFRLIYGGAHLRLGVEPDIAVFAKTLANGHPIGAVIGTAQAMDGAHDSFISSTYWTESVGPAAALAALKKMACIDVPAHVARVGERIQAAWREAAERHGLLVSVEDGYPCFANFSFEHELSGELRTLYAQLMLPRGFLAGTAVYPTLAHTEEVTERYCGAIDEVFAVLAKALEAGAVKDMLDGPVAHSTFARLI